MFAANLPPQSGLAILAGMFLEINFWEWLLELCLYALTILLQYIEIMYHAIVVPISETPESEATRMVFIPQVQGVLKLLFHVSTIGLMRMAVVRFITKMPRIYHTIPWWIEEHITRNFETSGAFGRVLFFLMRYAIPTTLISHARLPQLLRNTSIFGMSLGLIMGAVKATHGYKALFFYGITTGSGFLQLYLSEYIRNVILDWITNFINEQ